MATRAACLALGLLAVWASSAAAQVRSEIIVRGLVAPVAVLADPSDREIFFIVEQRGTVRAARNGVLVAQPVLDLRSDVRSGGEQGLLGMALAPDYAVSRRFFVNFTNRDGDTVIARFRTRADRPLEADPGSRLDLQWSDGRRVIDQPFENHNGGHLAFGADGYLYAGLGDGGSGGDPLNHAQNPRSLLGKMLRLDIDVPDDDPRGYRVPEDNPFVDGEPVAALPEIWAFGVRNPWRYSFDDWTRGGTAALLLADVGQNAREEINFEPAGRGGRNYGWRLREGRLAFDARTAAAFTPLTEPVHDYARTLGRSVTGGFIYRGSALDPGLEGRYFYGDFVTGRVFSIGLHLDPVTGEATADDEREHTAALGADQVSSVSAFGQDPDGELLVLNYQAGTVLRVVPDLGLVPGAPALEAAPEGEITRLTWREAAGVPARGFTVEVVRDRRVIQRTTVERPEAAIRLEPGDCIRVRGVSTSGPQGPPSSPHCAPLASR